MANQLYERLRDDLEHLSADLACLRENMDKLESHAHQILALCGHIRTRCGAIEDKGKTVDVRHVIA